MDFRLTKEQKDIKKAAMEFALGEFPQRSQEFDRTETFDPAIRKKCAELGFVAAYLPEKYGGAGLSVLENCLIIEEFYSVDAGMANACMSAGFGADLINLYGSEEQKKEYLIPITSGEAVMGCAVTEPDAGSDPSGAVTTAVQDGDEFVIDGSKMFITNGNIADYLVVFCLTDLKSINRHNRHTFFMVETDRVGYKANKLTGKMGIRANDTAQVFFNHVRVPSSNMVGTFNNGFKQLMNFFNLTRIRVAAQGVGIARAALEEAISYCKKRHQFGAPIASFQIIQDKIAEMATRVRAVRNLCYEAAWLADRGTLDPALVAMAKWFAGETAVKCADEALQIHGGYGYLDDYKVQRLYRDAKIIEIYEGTKEIEKLIIARSLL